MARIVVETDDERLVLDERDIELADIRGESAIQLLDRLECAIRDAERMRVTARGLGARKPGFPVGEVRRRSSLTTERAQRSPRREYSLKGRGGEHDD
jgi:hypothetical protein